MSRINGAAMPTFQAAVAHGQKKPLIVEEVSLDALGEDEVLVKLVAAGLCHTDLALFDGTRDWTDYPIVLGHEGAGVVVECGKRVTSVREGDPVIPVAIPECGQCPACLSGKTNLCDHYFSKPPRRAFRLDKSPVRAWCDLGMFSQYAIVHETQVAKVRKDVPLADISCVACAGATGIGAAIFTAKVEPNTSVVVFGLGGIGINVIQGARLAGASRIIGVDTNSSKEVLARTAGLTHFVNPKELKEDLVGHLRELTGGGADYAFECVGSQSLLSQAIECTRIGWGTVVAIGIPPDGEAFNLRPRAICEGRRLLGSYLGNIKTRSQLPMLVDWHVEGKISLSQFVSHKIPLDQINEGFSLMKEGKSLRTVITFDQ